MIEDIFDAAIACWSDTRLSAGSLPDNVPLDAAALPMAIWV
jgi:predicted RNase H-like nuclease